MRKLKEIRLRYQLLRRRKKNGHHVHGRFRSLRIAIRITFRRKRILGQYP